MIRTSTVNNRWEDDLQQPEGPPSLPSTPSHLLSESQVDVCYRHSGMLGAWDAFPNCKTTEMMAGRRPPLSQRPQPCWIPQGAFQSCLLLPGKGLILSLESLEVGPSQDFLAGYRGTPEGKAWDMGSPEPVTSSQLWALHSSPSGCHENTIIFMCALLWKGLKIYSLGLWQGRWLNQPRKYEHLSSGLQNCWGPNFFKNIPCCLFKLIRNVHGEVSLYLSFWVKLISLCWTFLSLTFGVFLLVIGGPLSRHFACVCVGIVCVL